MDTQKIEERKIVVLRDFTALEAQMEGLKQQIKAFQIMLADVKARSLQTKGRFQEICLLEGKDEAKEVDRVAIILLKEIEDKKTEKKPEAGKPAKDGEATS